MCVHKNRRNTQYTLYAHHARIVHCIFGYVRKHRPSSVVRHRHTAYCVHIVPNLERIRFRLSCRFHILILYVVFFCCHLRFSFVLPWLVREFGETACYRTHAQAFTFMRITFCAYNDLWTLYAEHTMRSCYSLRWHTHFTHTHNAHSAHNATNDRSEYAEWVCVKFIYNFFCRYVFLLLSGSSNALNAQRVCVSVYIEHYECVSIIFWCE